MVSVGLVIGFVALAVPPQPQQAARLQELPRLPRIEATADLTLWRSVTPERLIFSRDPRPVFVRPQDEAAVAALERAGVAARVGSWQSARLDSVTLLELLGGVGRTELRAAPALRPMLDISVPEILAPEVHRTLGLDGSGVLIGIVDTGLDLSHPALVRADGSHRVVAVWDQDAVDGDPPAGFAYGKLCVGVELVDGSCGLTDPRGHGTHVTAIAAGEDGVAPGADIALVRSATFTHLADAVYFLTDLAAERDQPLVVNVSAGGHYGAHDGRTPLESYLEKLLGPGRIAVAAAGNDGAGHVHVGVDLDPEQKQRVGIEALPWGRAVEVTVELWGATSTRVELDLEVWEAQSLLVSASLSAPDSELLDGTVTRDGTAQGEPIVAVAFGAEIDADSGLARRTIILDPSVAAAPGVEIALAFSGEGRLDGWIAQGDYRYGMARFATTSEPGWIAGDGDASITVPATAAGIIAVGSYSVRDSWESETAGPQTVGEVAYGSLSLFSSRGPTLAPDLTGRKPNLIAPGSVIASARAVDVPSGTNTLDTERAVLQGTSMAAPHVTGVVALMLEADPTLTPEGVRQILQSSARSEVGANDEQGFGKLDARAAALAARTQAPGCNSLPTAAWPAGLLWAVALLWRRRRP